MNKNQMEYYSAKQVLNILGISMSTLQRIQNRGEITPEWAGGQRRYSIQAYSLDKDSLIYLFI